MRKTIPKHRLNRKPKSKSRTNSLMLGASSLIFATILTAPCVITSQAAFVSSATSNVQVASTRIEAPTNLTVKNVRAGETDISWTTSTSNFITGYKILRSESKYGPWTEIGQANGRTTSQYVDKLSGSKAWNYRVESVFNGWESTGPAFQAPPPVGLSFYDSFTIAGNLDGRQTEDGKSVWQVWNGGITVNNSSGWTYAAHATGYETKPAIGVVRTPTQNAKMFGKDFDGSEGFVLRGKDPMNYIYAGGAMTPVADDGSFEIVEYKNGVRNVLFSGKTGAVNRDMRLEVNGTQIKVYIDAVNGVANSGTVFATVNSSFLYGDPTATYFGIGFTNSFGFLGFYFDAIV